jgi:hypothetical protein
MSGQTATQGAVTQMAAQGLADAVLTGNPQVTFWRFVAKAYTNFALESQLLDFTAGQPYFGNFPKCNLDRIGDLVYWMYAVFDMPGIGCITYDVEGDPDGIAPFSIFPTVGTPVEAPYYTRAVGQAIIQQANFFIGGQNIDYIKGEYLFIWEELSGQPGKRLKEMTGNYVSINALQRASSQPRRLYVPLPFWFTLNSGLALPLVSLQFHSVAVSLQLRPWQHLIKLTKPTMDAPNNYSVSGTIRGIFLRPAYDAPIAYWSNYPLPALAASTPSTAVQPVSQLVQNLQSQDLNGYIEACYVYLDQRERSKFADGAFEQLMIEHQDTDAQYETSISLFNSVAGVPKEARLELNFNHTIIELLWAVRLGVREGFNGKNTVGAFNNFYNEWFDFGGLSNPVTGVAIDPIDSIQLRLNNATRFGNVEGRYFRLVQPWQHHTNIPKEFIYSYSFALQPEDVQPSGSCNFSRIDNTQLNVYFNRHLFFGPTQEVGGTDGNTAITFMVFATNWNILRFKYGLGGKRFAN